MPPPAFSPVPCTSDFLSTSCTARRKTDLLFQGLPLSVPSKSIPGWFPEVPCFQEQIPHPWHFSLQFPGKASGCCGSDTPGLQAPLFRWKNNRKDRDTGLAWSDSGKDKSAGCSSAPLVPEQAPFPLLQKIHDPSGLGFRRSLYFSECFPH